LKGKVGYEIFVDRFYNFNNKGYPFIPWNIPVKAHDKQEYDFYGGNLKGISKKIEYLKKLSVDFIYITPVFKANTNHRYDTLDFFCIDEKAGTERDLLELKSILKENSIELYMDIALNHTSRFNSMKENIDFYTGKNWANVENLPELNLESAELKNYLFREDSSVMKSYLRKGLTNWRFDCAYDLGYEILKEIKHNMDKVCENEVIGEVWSYPLEWCKVIDGVMNYYFQQLIKMLLYGKIDGTTFTAAVAKTSEECGDKIFKNWNILSTHDTPRIKNIFGDLWKIAVILQFTVPGSPLVYYGEEIGMQGEGDPYCRQPMLWQEDLQGNEAYCFYLKLIDEYKKTKGINSGRFKQLSSSDSEVVCFERTSDEIRDTRFVIANPTNKMISACIITENSSLMNYSKIKDVFSEIEFEIFSSCIDAVIPPKFAGVFKIKEERSSYNPYKRIP